MLISFVVPALNEEHGICDCVYAIRNDIEEYGIPESAEIIVVDNGSTDNTELVAFEAGATVIREPRRGTNRARDTGFRASKGKLIAFIDADTQIEDGYLARVVERFAAEPDLACLAGRVTYPEPKWLRNTSVPFFAAVKAMSLVAPTMQGANFVVRRTALEAIDGFDTSIKFYGDDTSAARALAKVGKFRVDLKLNAYSSPRRIVEQGLLPTLYRYWLTGFLGTYLRKDPNRAAHQDYR